MLYKSNKLGSLLLLSALLTAGCGSPTQSGQSEDSAPELVIAIDTSGSAVKNHPEYFGGATKAIQRAPRQRSVYLYRFDSSPAEVFSEQPPNNKENIGKLLNELLEHRSKKIGTDLARLVALIDKQLSKFSRQTQVIIFTDCGIERMTEQDKKLVTQIASEWAEKSRLSELTLVGVAPEYRGELRELFDPLGDKVQFLRRL